MRLFHLAILVLIVSVAMLSLPSAQVPLTLTASVDRDVLLANRLLYFRAMKDNPNFEVESAQVTLTFTNTGDAPMKLNTYELIYARLQLEITGPDASSVLPQRSQYLRRPVRPTEADFPMLQPGKSWTMAMPITFPEEEIGDIHYILQRTGVYHLRFRYAFVPSQDELAGEDAVVNGAFQGMVASNSLTIKLVEASGAVNGLEIALDCQPAADPTSGNVTVIGYLRNVSQNPITVNAWNLFHDGLQFIGDDGKLLPFSGGNARSRIASLAERFATIPPGEKCAFPLRAAYRPRLDTLTAQMGDFGAEDGTGFFRNWPVQGASCRAYAVLESPTEEAADAPAPLWKGKVTSPTIVIPFNPTAYRQARLKQEVAQFGLELNFVGEHGKPYYTLHLQMQPQDNDGTRAFYRVVVITTPEAQALIDSLAKDGALRDAISMETAANNSLAPANGYTMSITGDIRGKGDLAAWSLALGWDLAMYRQLQALRAQIPAHGQQGMDTLLTSLNGMREQWAATDALCQPAVTLDTPAGALYDAAHAVVTALNCPGVQLSIDLGAIGKTVPAYHFFNVTALAAFQSLATATNVNFTLNGPTATFSSLQRSENDSLR